MAWRGGGLTWAAGKYSERFESTRYALAIEAVVAMLPLAQHFDQPLFLEPAQVHARRGGADLSHNRQFSAGSGVPVQQAIEHARPGGLPNGRGDACGTDFYMGFSNHIWIVDELRIGANWQSRLAT